MSAKLPQSVVEAIEEKGYVIVEAKRVNGRWHVTAESTWTLVGTAKELVELIDAESWVF